VVNEPPEVLSIVVPEAIVNVPAVVPKAAAALILIVPALCVTPPVKVLVPERVSVPRLLWLFRKILKLHLLQ